MKNNIYQKFVSNETSVNEGKTKISDSTLRWNFNK